MGKKRASHLAQAILLAVTLAGCSSSPSPVTTPPPVTPPPVDPPPPAKTQYLYLPETLPTGTGAVLQIPLTATGTVTSTTTITDAAGGLGYICIDASGNTYAVETTIANNVSNFAIVEYAANAAGAATPIRRISGSATGIDPFPSPVTTSIDPIAVDAKGDIAIGVGSTIEVFDATANGNVAPSRIITTTPGVLETVHITLTSAGVISTVNLGPAGYQVFTFPAGSSGFVTPTIVTTFPFNTLVDGLLTDSAGNIYVASTFVTVDTNTNTFTSFTPTIQVFAPGATSPTKTITPANDPVRMASLQLDANGNLYVLCEDIALTDEFIETFPSTATGPTSPLTTISSPAFDNTDGTIALY